MNLASAREMQHGQFHTEIVTGDQKGHFPGNVQPTCVGCIIGTVDVACSWVINNRKIVRTSPKCL